MAPTDGGQATALERAAVTVEAVALVLGLALDATEAALDLYERATAGRRLSDPERQVLDRRLEALRARAARIAARD